MKRIILPFLCLALIAVICINSFTHGAAASSSDPSYTSDAITNFNSLYDSSKLSSLFVYPLGFSGSNVDLNGFYPLIIGQGSECFIYFAKSIDYVYSGGSLKISLFNVFSYSFDYTSVVSLSSIAIPSSLTSKLTLSYSNNNCVDSSGVPNYLIYLPTELNIQSSTGMTVYNHFSFPIEGDYPVSDEDEIEYSQVLSADINLEFSSYDAYSYDEGEFSNAIDLEGAMSDIEDDIHDAKNGFHHLFEDLIDAFGFGSVIMILLTAAFAFYVIGRL